MKPKFICGKTAPPVGMPYVKKQSYRTPEEAEDAVLKSGHKYNMRVYLCPSCGWYHITTRK